MTATRSFRVDDYELLCSAEASDSGKFEPALVISKQVWPTRPRTIAVRRGAHESADTAIEAARMQGVEWVRDYG